MRTYNGDSVLKVETPPEPPLNETEIDPLVDPMTNPVVDPVSAPLDPTIGVDDKTDATKTDSVNAELTDGANPYSDVAPAFDNTTSFTETSEFEGTPL